MKQTRKLTNRTKSDTFGGPRGSGYGQVDESNLGMVSGETYAGQGDGWYWNQYPSVTGGLTEYNPQALLPGSNMSAVQWGAEDKAKKAGLDLAAPTGASVGGTAAY